MGEAWFVLGGGKIWLVLGAAKFFLKRHSARKTDTLLRQARAHSGNEEQ
jgi:hypothetical protein